jgi:manganese/zinc/iron transport system permease protein
VVALNGVFVIVLFKELRISSFDPELAAAQGMSPSVMHYLLMTLVAITTVAAFEAVGSILVVAMLIVPGLAAHLLTERLGWMLIVSVLLAVIASVGGYAASAQLSVNAAAMIGVAMGALLIVVGVAAPKHGWISRSLHRASLSLAILREDLLGCLYRLQEAGHGRTQITAPELRTAIGGGLAAALALWWMRVRGEARVEQGIVRLTGDGAARAASLVRSHRLWEAYLVEHLGLRPDHVHETATRLEHVTGTALQDRLAAGVQDTATDPHGKSIPSPPEP